MIGLPPLFLTFFLKQTLSLRFSFLVIIFIIVIIIVILLVLLLLSLCPPQDCGNFVGSKPSTEIALLRFMCLWNITAGSFGAFFAFLYLWHTFCVLSYVSNCGPFEVWSAQNVSNLIDGNIFRKNPACRIWHPMYFGWISTFRDNSAGFDELPISFLVPKYGPSFASAVVSSLFWWILSRAELIISWIFKMTSRRREAS